MKNFVIIKVLVFILAASSANNKNCPEDGEPSLIYLDIDQDACVNVCDNFYYLDPNN